MTIQKFTTASVMVLAALTLTACGPELENLLKSAEFDAIDEAAGALVAEGEALFDAEGYTDPMTLPPSGSADYAGFIGIETDDVQTIGELELTADFSGAGSISGSATNFVNDDSGSYSGTLTVSNGVIDRAADLNNFDYTFNADIDGTLTSGGDDFVVSGLMEGDFIGNDHEFIGGDVTGTVVTSEGVEVISGEFGAKR